MPEIAEQVVCYHCGEDCPEALTKEEKSFCCQGCLSVYEILSNNDLGTYYDLDANAGLNQRERPTKNYDYLDEPQIRQQLLDFDSDTFACIKFQVPAIHCVSCLWLLENIRRLDAGIGKSEVNFAQKSVRIDFDPGKRPLSSIATLLSKLGYPPQISLASLSDGKEKRAPNPLIVQLAVAGFCFGNIMLFSFPEYLGLDGREANIFAPLFGALNLLLSLPVLAYSGKEYFLAAIRALRQRQINIDVPIAVGLTVLFVRSTWDVVVLGAPGYFDSLAGLVFFLLIGRWFQGKTYESLAFDRDYQSYFPLAVDRWENKRWAPTIIHNIDKGDRIRIRNGEIAPADSMLSSSGAYIDYSFVTGESQPVSVEKGGVVFAGGRLTGKPAELVVRKKTSQSYLTSLWNEGAFTKPFESNYKKIIDEVARWFTWVVLAVSTLTGLYWFSMAPGQVWTTVTAVLIVACPCALALAAPFTYGNLTRVFGQHGLYLKNADIIERMAVLDTVVLDKTGTITYGKGKLAFVGHIPPLYEHGVRALINASTHPLSKIIADSFPSTNIDIALEEFCELPGAGIKAVCEGDQYKVGSASFVGATHHEKQGSSRVYVAVNGKPLGYYSIAATVRPFIKALLQKLKGYRLAMLSGDNSDRQAEVREIFPATTELHFNQAPHDKLRFISELQKEGHAVMMIGDGLNDSGALRESDVGIAVSDNKGIFSPACDGILEGNRLSLLHGFMNLAKTGRRIVKIAFGVSLMYNIVAISIAALGLLSPLLAAILMPLSSISVVGFTTLAVNYSAARQLRTKMTAT